MKRASTKQSTLCRKQWTTDSLNIWTIRRQTCLFHCALHSTASMHLFTLMHHCDLSQYAGQTLYYRYSCSTEFSVSRETRSLELLTSSAALNQTREKTRSLSWRSQPSWDLGSSVQIQHEVLWRMKYLSDLHVTGNALCIPELKNNLFLIKRMTSLKEKKCY